MGGSVNYLLSVFDVHPCDIRVIFIHWDSTAKISSPTSRRQGRMLATVLWWCCKCGRKRPCDWVKIPQMTPRWNDSLRLSVLAFLLCDTGKRYPPGFDFQMNCRLLPPTALGVFQETQLYNKHNTHVCVCDFRFVLILLFREKRFSVIP